MSRPSCAKPAGAVYPLADIAAAHARLESANNGLRGKIAIAVGGLADRNSARLTSPTGKADSRHKSKPASPNLKIPFFGAV